jgi:geranylgeranyl pyrophosphate synthase
MPWLESASPDTFVEAHWQAAQRRRGARLFAWVDAWLKTQPLDEPLASRLRARALPWASGVVEGPGTFIVCAAESLGLGEPECRRLGVAAELFWAAADVADDVDDGETQCGFAPQANDGCAMLFLAMRALLELGPGAVQLGNRFGLQMAGGQARDLAATGRPSAFDPFGIAADKAGAEAAFFLALAAESAGRAPAGFERLGGVLGMAMQVFSDVADVYMAQHSLDLETAKHTPMLRAFAAARPARAETLLAAQRDWPDVQMALRFEMRDGAIEALASLVPAIQAAWGALAPDLPQPAPLGELVQWVLGLLHVAADALRELEAPEAVRLPAPASVLDRAKRFLNEGPFTERHTWGLFGRDEVRGDLFPTILVTAALRESGGPWQPGLAHLLRLGEPPAWRYYPGHAEIPHDADDTGLMLGYFGDVMPPGVRAAATAALVNVFEEAAIHTWLTPAPGPIEWQGDDCVATLANAAWGLVRVGAAGAVPRGVWRRLARCAREGDFASPFYTPEATRHALLRSLGAAARAGCITAAELAGAQAGFMAWYARERRWGGATADSLLATAINALALLECGQTPPGDLATYLGARQEVDGAWPGEPLFMIPSVDYRPVRWGHPALTTSIVVTLLTRLPAQ